MLSLDSPSPSTHIRLHVFGGGPLEGERLMRVVYVDEAGTSLTEPVLTVAAVVVDADRQLVALERHLDKLVERWIPEHQRNGFVFHATELFNGTRRGSGRPFERDHPDWPMQKRLEIADQLAAIPAKFNLPVTVGWVERDKFPASAPAIAHWQTCTPAQKAVISHVCAFMACALKVDHWMRKHTNNEVCMLIVEDNEQARSMIRETQSHHQQKNVADFLRGETKKYFPLRRIKEDPLFQQKRPSSVLQLADFCAYVFKKFVLEDARYWRFYEPIKSHAFEFAASPSEIDGR